MDRSLYTRPNKPKTVVIPPRVRDFAPDGGLPQKIELLSVDRSTECHVTPAHIAVQMVDYLDLRNGLSLLEPQCGTGNLIAATLEDGSDLKITAVEKYFKLRECSERRFAGKNIEFIQNCFLEFAESTTKNFDRILTNPPFKKSKQHIAASLSLLAPGGIMIALVPITFNHDDATDLEVLERGIFASTDVNTKLIRFYG